MHSTLLVCIQQKICLKLVKRMQPCLMWEQRHTVNFKWWKTSDIIRTLYSVFAKQHNYQTLLLSACESKMPQSSDKKMQSRISVIIPCIINMYMLFLARWLGHCRCTSWRQKSLAIAWLSKDPVQKEYRNYFWINFRI